MVDDSISDHYLLLHVLDQPLLESPAAHSYVQFKINDGSLCSFAQDLALTDWTLFISSCEADQAFSEFYDCFMAKFYAHFPRINHTKRGTKDKPWFNDTLCSLVQDKKSVIS